MRRSWPSWPPARCRSATRPSTPTRTGGARTTCATILVANQVLPARDEALVRTERFLAELLASIDHDRDRRLVAAFATWRVLRRLRRGAERRPRPRTYTRRARQQISAAARFLAWLADRHLRLRELTQADLDTWLAGGQENYQVRDFLGWASEHGHCRSLHVPPLGRGTGAATSDTDRYAQLSRLLHDENLELTDRVAGVLLLLYGQPLSRITAITTDQITRRDQQVFLRFGHHDVHLPEPLAGLVVALARHGRRYLGVGTPAATAWLFPGQLPGRPLTPARLGERLRTLGIHTQPGRRAALTSLAAQLPAAVLAELLQPAPHHRGPLGPRRRRGLEPLRRPTRPSPRSPTMTNASNTVRPAAGHSTGWNTAGYQFGRRGAAAGRAGLRPPPRCPHHPPLRPRPGLTGPVRGVCRRRLPRLTGVLRGRLQGDDGEHRAMV